ncbi:transcriptional regulator ATRX homolog isoform X2 [Contarinia nasturtii]|uniref:transcriptional regulator ATRX homolog isoform X2 n=1 Tax=Contarinia nasturtii TaxID=265458 RepID=UPI0012D3EFD5|nr:transcriptional regulator ATRX homolog isoform X2 [Contarinia nasturtii]
MNRKKVNGTKPNVESSSVCKGAYDECGESNSTDSFDMNDFKSAALTKKYSVQIHKNNADLMAELDNINIMGDESDVEMIEPNTSKLNGANNSVSHSSSNVISLNTTHASDDPVNGDFEHTKHDRILAWAQSQSQNLSTCIESVLSDHDYLSQERLLGIIAGIEENTELESQRETNSNKSKEQSENEKSKDHGELNGGDLVHTKTSKILTSKNIDDLSEILKQLANCKEHAQRLSLVEKIEKSAKDMKAQLNQNNGNTTGNNSVANANDITSLEFSSNHSAQSSIDGPKDGEVKCCDLVAELQTELKSIDDMANRIATDTASIRSKLGDIEKQPQAEKSISKLRVNLSLLVEDVSKELKKVAIKLNPTMASVESKRENKSENRSLSHSTDEDSDISKSRRKIPKLKRRRKKPKGNTSDSTALSSSSEDSFPVAKNDTMDEPFVVTQNIDDLINQNGSNSANGSIRKENDFLGFDNVDFENGIKNEEQLSESISSQQQLSDKDQNKMDTSNELSEQDTQIINQKATESEQSNNSALTKKSTDVEDISSDAFILSDDFIEEDHGDDDDDDIRKLLDFTSIENKRIASTNAAAKVNGIVVPKKLEPKTKASKENAVENFLANSTDTDKPIESDDEKSEHEEYTDEHYLKEQNQMFKDQLLQDSSDSEMNSDSDQRVNGKGIYSETEDSDRSSDSNQSIMEKFLASESKGSGQKSTKDKEGKSKAGKVSSDNEKKSEPKTKDAEIEKNIDHFIEELDSDIEFDASESESVSEAPRKTQSTIGKHIFANIEKDKQILIPSDEENESSKKKDSQTQKSEADSSEKDSSEILDTTMFKSSKSNLTATQLSKVLQTNRNKQTKSRVSPECISVSSDDDLEIESTSKKDGNEDEDEEKEKRVTRKLLRHDQLADDTKQAQREEADRLKRLDKKNERLTQFLESQRQSQSETEKYVDPNQVCLDVDSKENVEIVVHPEITKHLKPHQVEGIKFMYDCCYGSVDNMDKYSGSGCILAHCMGLGKTLQLITLLHTVICYTQLKTDKVLVICPKSTVMNWKEEIERWLGAIKKTRRLKVFYFPEQSDISSKLQTLSEWSQCGKDGNKQAGCLLLGYEAFRVLVFYHASKKSLQMYSTNELEKIRQKIHKYLLDPGADLVVCDEGHMIKNQKSTTSAAVNKISTRRRIVLTGTPIQNNLKEYYSMVNFIKPSFLGTEKEFANLYVNPIKSGQHKDSSKSEIKHMKQRSFVLHKKLSKFVQRKEAALLKSFLPEKYEFVLFIPMTKIQTNLYEFFLENRPNQDQKGKSLIPDYTVLRKIWTHPKVLENAYLNAIQNKTKVKSAIPTTSTTTTANNDSDDDQPDDVFDSQTGQMSVTSDWWRQHLTKEDLETILPSNKLKILFEILARCRRNKEKCLIFSAFVAVLDVVEFFMKLINDQEKDGNKPGLETFRGPWEIGKDYYRLDGKTAKNHRHNMITNFNDPKNERTRAFLISAKAGGQGINLIGANRVVLLDTSWNPSNDQQNIFRVFRLGQKKICYIYRLISMGTMEEKVYSRSVTKQAMSCRVVDEQQCDRHYNMAELTELYTLTKPNMKDRQTPNVPKDDLLASLLMQFPQMVYKYHEHDSLLENKGEEELSEQEKNDAWAAYEADVKRKNETNMGPYSNNFGMLPNYPGLGTYANSLFNNYNNLSGLNYPYNMYGSYNPYANDLMRFDNYSQFYNNLMNVAGTSMTNYNQGNPSLLSPSHQSSSASSPSPIMNSFSSSSRNWMQSNASSTNYANNLLSSLAQTSSSSKSSYSSYLNSLYNALGTNNPTASSSSAANASSSKTPPLPITGTDYNQMAYLQKQQLSHLSATSPSSSTTSMTVNSSAQQGPNALRNPLLTKELSIPRNLTMSNTKEMFSTTNIPTSVITKSGERSTPSASSTSPNLQNDASKSSTDTNISSSIDKTDTRPTKTTSERHLTIKNAATINAEARGSPDTTAKNQAQNKSISNGVSSTVSSAIDSVRKTNNKSATSGMTISTNMGIVYPSQKPINQSTASTSKNTTNSILLSNTKPKDKSPQNPISATSSVSSKSQPLAAIIRKQPIQSTSSKSVDPTNDAVAAINKNKALTVTARNITPTAAAAAKPPVTGVNNSITLSPIPNNVSKYSGSSMTITPQVNQVKVHTPQQSRTLSKSNSSSPVPLAITKVTSNHPITKSPIPMVVTKPNILSSRNSNTSKTLVSVPKLSNATTINTSGVRILNSNQSLSPKAGPRPPGFKPIIAQTKSQAVAAASASIANKSGMQIKEVTSLAGQKPVNRPSPLDTRKRLANDPIALSPAKKPKPMAKSSTPPGVRKPRSSLAGIRINMQSQTQQDNSQVPVPVEIVELE